MGKYDQLAGGGKMDPVPENSDPQNTADSYVYIQQFADKTVEKTSRSSLAYLQSGADEEITLRRNRTDYLNYCILPRLFRNSAPIDTTTTLLGAPVSMPIGVAPTGYQRLFHKDGEVANARACASMKALFTMSTMATSTIPEVAESVPTSPKWHQIYIFRSRAITERMVKRIVKSGFKALVLTADAVIPGKRRSGIINKLYMPPPLTIPNLEDTGDYKRDLLYGMGEAFDDTIDWSCLGWLKQISGLPIVIKGILTGEDAKLALEHGADAIWVSNHGGRQVDYAPSTISVLSEVLEAVSGRCEVYIDGGILTGAQVFIALALGARAVFIGRAAVYGLTCLGEAGVRRVLEILHEELKISMILAGCRSVDSITKSHVRLNAISKL